MCGSGEAVVQESRRSAASGQGASGTGGPDSKHVGEQEWHAGKRRGRSAGRWGGATHDTVLTASPLCVAQGKGSVSIHEQNQCNDLDTPCRWLAAAVTSLRCATPCGRAALNAHPRLPSGTEDTQGSGGPNRGQARGRCAFRPGRDKGSRPARRSRHGFRAPAQAA